MSVYSSEHFALAGGQSKMPDGQDILLFLIIILPILFAFAVATA